MSDAIETFRDERTGCTAEIVYDQYPDSPRNWDNVFKLCLKQRDYTLVEEDIEPYMDEAGEAIERRIEEIVVEIARPYQYGSRVVALDKELASLQVVSKEGFEYPRRPTMEEVEKVYEGRIFPVYAYVHSGIALSIGRGGQFSDPWDSGILGFAMVKNEAIQREFHAYYPDGRWAWTNPNGEVEDHGDVEDWLHERLVGEIEALEDYWMGRVYCIDVTFPDGENCFDCDAGCGIYDHDAWKSDGYVQTQAKQSLAYAVEEWDNRQAKGMLALDEFASVSLV